MKNESNINEQVRQALVKIRERKFGLKELGVSSRVISNWQQQGLLIEGMISEDRKGKKLNLIEWVWFKMINHQTHVSVPLINILKEFITEKQYESFDKAYSLVTDDEIELLQYLRKGNLKEARIRFNKNDEIHLLELTEFRTNVKKEARLMDYMKTGGIKIFHTQQKMVES